MTNSRGGNRRSSPVQRYRRFLSNLPILEEQPIGPLEIIVISGFNDLDDITIDDNVIGGPEGINTFQYRKDWPVDRFTSELEEGIFIILVRVTNPNQFGHNLEVESHPSSVVLTSPSMIAPELIHSLPYVSVTSSTIITNDHYVYKANALNADAGFLDLIITVPDPSAQISTSVAVLLAYNALDIPQVVSDLEEWDAQAEEFEARTLTVAMGPFNSNNSATLAWGSIKRADDEVIPPPTAPLELLPDISNDWLSSGGQLMALAYEEVQNPAWATEAVNNPEVEFEFGFEHYVAFFGMEIY